MERLQRSLKELRIALPMPLAALSVVLHETVRRNRVSDGIVYLQVTRGVARRDFAFPAATTRPSIVVTARRIPRQQGDAVAAAGIVVVTVPETRSPRRRRATAARARPGSWTVTAMSPRARRRMPGSSPRTARW
jgi:D-alanine transaminase